MRSSLFSMVTLAVVFILWPAAAESVFGQDQQQEAAPTPRNPDGSVNWGIPDSPKGVWSVQGGTFVARDPESGRPQADPADVLVEKPTLSQVPFQPWARAIYDLRQENPLEPYTRCKPSGAFRQVATAYGTQMVYFPELQRFFIFQTGGPHTFRVIYLDGRDHPENVTPSYYGHNIGWFEGDTLVVDTVGYNERMWISNLEGIPNSGQLHTTERFTRLDFNTIKYEITVDDPGTYTEPWSTGWRMNFNPDNESFEFSCQEGNKAFDLMVGTMEAVDRSSPFVP